MYTCFPSKEALFATLCADRLDTLLGELQTLSAQATSLEDLFAGFLQLKPGVRPRVEPVVAGAAPRGKLSPGTVTAAGRAAQDIINLMQQGLLRLSPAADIDLARLPELPLRMPLLWSIWPTISAAIVTCWRCKGRGI